MRLGFSASRVFFKEKAASGGDLGIMGGAETTPFVVLWAKKP